MDLDGLREDLVNYGQGHLIQFWESLTDDQKECLFKDIKSIDFEEVIRIFNKSQEKDEALEESLLEPLPDDVHESVTRSSPEVLRSYREEGLKSIADGRVAVLLLAGGQGTRLGVNYPKGMFDVGLPSHKTLYQLQGERIRRLEQLSLDLTGKSCEIPWYIMTSEQTKEKTLQFFQQNDYFGLSRQNVIIFEQNTLPCFTRNGKVILETEYKLARAPDGNGGLYAALRREGILADMELRGIEYVHVYCVDNILVKMADPTFIGYCISKGAEAGAKVVEKSFPTEAVGIICKVRGEFQVVEYSEITQSTAEARNPDGRLTFNAGSICNHFFTVEFLKRVSDGKELKHHVALKKIPYIDSNGQKVTPETPNGIKLEKFVFDVFHFTEKFVVWEVLRDEEFSPMKNAEGAQKDTPLTARNSLYRLHRRYVTRAGGLLVSGESNGVSNGHSTPENGLKQHELNGHQETSDDAVDDDEFICEISPLLSYDGEGLRGTVAGKKFSPPLILWADGEMQVTPAVSQLKSNLMSSDTKEAALLTSNGVH